MRSLSESGDNNGDLSFCFTEMNFSTKGDDSKRGATGFGIRGERLLIQMAEEIGAIKKTADERANVMGNKLDELAAAQRQIGEQVSCFP